MRFSNLFKRIQYLNINPNMEIHQNDVYNLCNRQFNIGDSIYVIDYYNNDYASCKKYSNFRDNNGYAGMEIGLVQVPIKTVRASSLKDAKNSGISDDYIVSIIRANTPESFEEFVIIKYIDFDSLNKRKAKMIQEEMDV